MLLQQFELLAEKSKSEEADIYECTLAMCEIARYLDACEIKIIRQSANRIRFPFLSIDDAIEKEARYLADKKTNGW